MRELLPRPRRGWADRRHDTAFPLCNSVGEGRYGRITHKFRYRHRVSPEILGAVAEHEVGPASSIKEIVEFGKRAYGWFGDATREGFYCIIDTIKALWWLRVGHQLGGDVYARAAKRMGVSRSTAFRIVHLYPHLDK